MRERKEKGEDDILLLSPPLPLLIDALHTLDPLLTDMDPQVKRRRKKKKKKKRKKKKKNYTLI